jgi:hypothetical protein
MKITLGRVRIVFSVLKRRGRERGVRKVLGESYRGYGRPRKTDYEWRKAA